MKRLLVVATAIFVAIATSAGPCLCAAGDLQLLLRSQVETQPGSGRYETISRKESWNSKETALVVCDVWDLHHSVNAVRRLEEFLPRLNDVLTKARNGGTTIIHSPSDCMNSYAGHPARMRALQTPKAERLPAEIHQWCSRIPAEERAMYPIDQSDGGDDDDPQEHAAWAAKLKTLGRNPGTPWQRQSDMITIDPACDYITDRGDEAWNILEARGIKHVILTGVHTNMCVLGRPFGLRQMVRGGKQVALMRDMTDTMYNPACWPYVSHFAGTDLIIGHIERFVCPTVTSDHFLGGKPFRFKGDVRPQHDFAGTRENSPEPLSSVQRGDFKRHWSLVSIPESFTRGSDGPVSGGGPLWYRCVIRVPDSWQGQHMLLSLGQKIEGSKAWFNGNPLKRDEQASLNAHTIEPAFVEPGDANLLVVRLERFTGNGGSPATPSLRCSDQVISLRGRWQLRVGDDTSWSNMPLPAKFGTPTDIVFDNVTQPHARLLEIKETDQSLQADGKTALAKGEASTSESKQAALQAADSPAKRPNLILIMADDLGYETIGANGGTSYRTPQLDKLAATGARFTNCFVQPLCTPTRVQLMTGLYNARNYISFGNMDPRAVTFANLLKSGGYTTCIAGKWQLGRDLELPRKFGFDEYCLWQHTRRPPRYANPGLDINGVEKDFNNGEYGPDLVNDYALDFIARHQDTPFFLYYPMMLTHDPYQPTPDSRDWSPKAQGEKVNADGKHFADMVTYMDKLIGKLVVRLDSLGIRENTLLVFVGDNGTGRGTRSMMGDRPVIGGKGTTTDAGMHVPLIVNWPGQIDADKVCADLVDGTDFTPTLLEAAGVQPPSSLKLDGRSFLPQVRGGTAKPRDWIYSWYSPRQSGDTTVREFAFNHDYKLYHSGEFFDLRNDIGEKQPLVVASLHGKAAAAAKLLQGRLINSRMLDRRDSILLK